MLNNVFSHLTSCHSKHTAPLECFIMQGEHPLPASVIEKFAKTGGVLAKDVFLLRMSLHTSPEDVTLISVAQQINLES